MVSPSLPFSSMYLLLMSQHVCYFLFVDSQILLELIAKAQTSWYSVYVQLNLVVIWT